MVGHHISMQVKIRDNHSGTFIHGFGMETDVSIPPWAIGDPQMEEIHIECQTRMKALVEFRKHLQKNPDLNDFIQKHNWSVVVDIHSSTYQS